MSGRCAPLFPATCSNRFLVPSIPLAMSRVLLALVAVLACAASVHAANSCQSGPVSLQNPSTNGLDFTLCYSYTLTNLYVEASVTPVATNGWASVGYERQHTALHLHSELHSAARARNARAAANSARQTPDGRRRGHHRHHPTAGQSRTHTSTSKRSNKPAQTNTTRDQTNRPVDWEQSHLESPEGGTRSPLFPFASLVSCLSVSLRMAAWSAAV